MHHDSLRNEPTMRMDIYKGPYKYRNIVHFVDDGPVFFSYKSLKVFSFSRPVGYDFGYRVWKTKSTIKKLTHAFSNKFFNPRNIF